MPGSRRRMYARGRRRTGRVIGALLAAAAVAVGLTAALRYLPWLNGSRSSPAASTSPSGPTGPRCPTARIPGAGPRGLLAWTGEGALHILDLDTCDERTLVSTGTAGPVRFSADGKWVAFGAGTVVSTAGGGEETTPIGRVGEWRWSPSHDVLAGVTPGGGVVLGGPGGARRVLLPDGAGVEHIAFSPNGKSIAVDAGGDEVQVVDLAGGAPTTVYRVTPGTKAPPEIAGWSPDGRWVLFWSRFRGKTGIPLNAAPVAGGGWTNVFDPVLPYEDFLSWCGDVLALSGGGERFPSEGNQILLSGPPAWRYHNLSQDFSRSWIWPACSPDGRWIAATATPNHEETPPGRGARSLWLLSADGKQRARIAGASGTAFEAPRWSADGHILLVVERGLEPDAPGRVVALRVDPSSGKTHRVPGTVARLGSAPGAGGHGDWSSVSDWYRPG